MWQSGPTVPGVLTTPPQEVPVFCLWPHPRPGWRLAHSAPSPHPQHSAPSQHHSAAAFYAAQHLTNHPGLAVWLQVAGAAATMQRPRQMDPRPLALELWFWGDGADPTAPMGRAVVRCQGGCRYVGPAYWARPPARRWGSAGPAFMGAHHLGTPSLERRLDAWAATSYRCRPVTLYAHTPARSCTPTRLEAHSKPDAPEVSRAGVPSGLPLAPTLRAGACGCRSSDHGVSARGHA